MNALTVCPYRKTFRKGDMVSLEQYLLDSHKNTYISPIIKPNDVMLNANGTTIFGKCRFTKPALAQLCQLMAPGLWQLVSDLTSGEAKTQAEITLLTRAINIINDVILLRFDRLAGRNLIRNDKYVIDGIVGAGYRFLSNKDLYHQIKDTKTKYPTLHEATMSGRYFVLRYARPDIRIRLMVDGVNDDYIVGTHYANSEVGESSVRGAPIIIRAKSGATCLGPNIKRVSHAGTISFEERLASLVATLDVDEAFQETRIAKSLQNLVTTSLGLGRSKDVKEEKKVRNSIVTRLNTEGLTLSLAEDVLLKAMVRGSGDNEGRADILDMQLTVLQRRTAYDIFVNLMDVARTLHIDTREKVEQVAYKLLFNKFSL